MSDTKMAIKLIDILKEFEDWECKHIKGYGVVCESCIFNQQTSYRNKNSMCSTLLGLLGNLQHSIKSEE